MTGWHGSKARASTICIGQSHLRQMPAMLPEKPAGGRSIQRQGQAAPSAALVGEAVIRREAARRGHERDLVTAGICDPGDEICLVNEQVSTSA